MMHAAIDIGSNTILLLVARYREGHFEILCEEKETPRLGKGIDGSGNLHPESMRKALKALKKYHKIIADGYPEVDETTVTATSAVRDAANRQEFLDEILEQTGYEVQVLSGSEEAELTFAGTMSMLPDINESIVIDIGGGSTEVIVGRNSQPEDRFSFNMGSVRFTERYLKGDPPSDSEIESCKSAIKEMLVERKMVIPFEGEKSMKDFTLAGVAGTVTSLATMDAGLEMYQPSQLNGYKMDVAIIQGWVDRLAVMTADEIRSAYLDVMKGRADVILAGLLILEGFMDFYGFRQLTVSTGGIRHGSVLKKANA